MIIISHDALAIHDRDLLAAAERYKLHRLIQIAEDHIGESLTPSNVIATLNLAAELKSERLDVCCSEFIATHQNDVLATNTLCHLHPDALRDLIGKSILPASSLLLSGAAPNSKSSTTSLAAADGANVDTAATNTVVNEGSEEFKNDGAGVIKEVMTEAGEKPKVDKDFIPAARGLPNTEIVSP